MSQIGGVVAEILGVDGPLAGLVVGDAADAGGGDVAVEGTRVGDVHGVEGGGEGDAAGLGERVFDDVDGARGGTEAVGGGRELGGCAGEVAEVSIVCWWEEEGSIDGQVRIRSGCGGKRGTLYLDR